MGLVENRGDEYALTDAGCRFVDEAVAEWADTEWAPDTTADVMTAGVYETTVQARAVDPEFRVTVLSRYDRTCPVSGVDHPGLLDVAHVLSWSDYPEHRADLGNVLPLSKTHHAAFDRELFTIDQDYRLRVNPAFETQSDLLQRTIIHRLKEFIQDGGLERLQGAYMTDLVDEVDPDSQSVEVSDDDAAVLLEQLRVLGESEYHVVCFGNKPFDRIVGYFDAEVTSHSPDLEQAVIESDGLTLSFYRVWFYGLYGANQDKVAVLKHQLHELNERIA